ncbi:hypothetical protein Fmac_009993 [Flemingia macrophylla]|uniref:Uncharacterized protein n=1 Tax=Flemingia macrophylla TaxID=520843 RepID=A0ABD1N1Y8_9FABA
MRGTPMDPTERAATRFNSNLHHQGEPDKQTTRPLLVTVQFFNSVTILSAIL